MKRKWMNWTAMAAVSATLAFGAMLPAFAGQRDDNGTVHHQRTDTAQNSDHANWNGQHHRNSNGNYRNNALSRRTSMHHRSGHQRHDYTGYNSGDRYNGNSSGAHWRNRQNGASAHQHDGSNYNGDTTRSHRDQNGQNSQRRDHGDNGGRQQ